MSTPSSRGWWLAAGASSALASCRKPYASRFTNHVTQFTLHASRFTFSVIRFTLHASRFTCSWTLLTLLLPTFVAAHDRTTSYSTWTINGRTAHVVVRLWEIDVTHFPWAAAAPTERDRLLGSYLNDHLELLAGSQRCTLVDAPVSLQPGAGRVAFEWRLSCPESGRFQVRSNILLEVAPSHTHFARVSRDGGRAVERMLSERERTWELDDTANGGSGTSLFGYVALGVERVLTSYDQLLFVLALLLTLGSFSEGAKVVAGFMVAHSLTLGLAVMGYVQAEHAPVEALIGLSVALVAAENLWLIGTRPPRLRYTITLVLGVMAAAAGAGIGRVPALTLAGLGLFSFCYFGLLARHSEATSLRWSIAFLFGLVHGFGFATALAQSGLPENRIVLALFGFNAGVETAQLLAVCLLWSILHWLIRARRDDHAALVELGSAALVTIGVFWFVSRTYG